MGANHEKRICSCHSHISVSTIYNYSVYLRVHEL